MAPIEIVERALIPAIREVGEKFERMEIFLTGSSKKLEEKKKR